MNIIWDLSRTFQNFVWMSLVFLLWFLDCYNFSSFNSLDLIKSQRLLKICRENTENNKSEWICFFFRHRLLQLQKIGLLYLRRNGGFRFQFFPVCSSDLLLCRCSVLLGHVQLAFMPFGGWEECVKFHSHLPFSLTIRTVQLVKCWLGLGFLLT